MEIADSARKHGVVDEDMTHAARMPVKIIHSASDQVLIIGADRDGRLLEVVVVDPEDDPVIIHAMPLRPKFYRYL